MHTKLTTNDKQFSNWLDPSNLLLDKGLLNNLYGQILSIGRFPNIEQPLFHKFFLYIVTYVSITVHIIYL